MTATSIPASGPGGTGCPRRRDLEHGLNALLDAEVVVDHARVMVNAAVDVLRRAVQDRNVAASRLTDLIGLTGQIDPVEAAFLVGRWLAEGADDEAEAKHLAGDEESSRYSQER